MIADRAVLGFCRLQRCWRTGHYDTALQHVVAMLPRCGLREAIRMWWQCWFEYVSAPTLYYEEAVAMLFAARKRRLTSYCGTCNGSGFIFTCGRRGKLNIAGRWYRVKPNAVQHSEAEAVELATIESADRWAALPEAVKRPLIN